MEARRLLLVPGSSCPALRSEGMILGEKEGSNSPWAAGRPVPSRVTPQTPSPHRGATQPLPTRRLHSLKSCAPATPRTEPPTPSTPLALASRALLCAHRQVPTAQALLAMNL